MVCILNIFYRHNLVGDEISKIWKIIGDLEAKSNNTLAASQDPSTFGELAKARDLMTAHKTLPVRTSENLTVLKIVNDNP